MTTLWGDLETFCETPLNWGTWKYAESAEVMLWCFAIDDGPVRVWDVMGDMLHWYEPMLDDWVSAPAHTMPDELFQALTDGTVEIVFHNVGFDRAVLLHAGSVVERAAAKALHRWRCTMARGLAHSLPGALEKQGEVLQTADETRKLREGKELVRLFCKPLPANQKLRRATRETHPEEWARFIRYGGRDIVAMRANVKRMPVWNFQGRELELWHLDQRINARGLCIDMPLVEAAIRASDRAKAELAAQTQEVTDGALTATTQRDALLEHLLAEHGVSLPDAQASTIERRLEDPALPWAVKVLLENRLQASSTTIAKYHTLKRGTSSDGRLRGTLQFCGAARTGRWAGRLFQPQNLASRGLLPPDEIDFGIDLMMHDTAHLAFDNVMHLCVSAVRGAIVAPPGKKLVCADLSNIEGRDQSWLAGESWKLQAFRDYDTVTGHDADGAPIRKGHDLYKLAYGKSFGIKPEAVTKDQRQVGKVQELALGYEGGVGAFMTFALVYGIDLEAMAEQAYPTLPADLRAEAESFLAWARDQKRPTFGLSDRAFVTCETFKRGWRRGHAKVAAYWGELAETVRHAIGAPGTTLTCGYLKVRRDGAWLRIGLPSGRALCYPSPEVAEGGAISYMGINQYSRKWERLKTYGGKLFENVCQAVARDVMAWNMPAIESAGYEIVATVHDEVVTEAPDSDEFTGERLAAMLAATPPWAIGMPLAAEAFEAKRYRK